MKKTIKKWLKDNKKTIATLVATFIATAIGAITMSCSSVQKINLNQENEKGEKQQMQIESNTQFKSLTLVVNSKL